MCRLLEDELRDIGLTVVVGVKSAWGEELSIVSTSVTSDSGRKPADVDVENGWLDVEQTYTKTMSRERWSLAMGGGWGLVVEWGQIICHLVGHLGPHLSIRSAPGS